MIEFTYIARITRHVFNGEYWTIGEDEFKEATFKTYRNMTDEQLAKAVISDAEQFAEYDYDKEHDLATVCDCYVYGNDEPFEVDKMHQYPTYQRTEDEWRAMQ